MVSWFTRPTRCSSSYVRKSRSPTTRCSKCTARGAPLNGMLDVVEKNRKLDMPSAHEFMEADFSSTLFPMKTNLIMAKSHGAEVADYIYQRILDKRQLDASFLPQQRVFATKPKGHLRRTIKLDPVADYFIYDAVYRNRSAFRGEVSHTRRSFGYRFKGGTYIPVHAAYTEFKACISEATDIYKHRIQFDITSYFNTIYHHDIAHWLDAKSEMSALDRSAFGQFFREINAGRSVDFLPQGIYPAKMIGNEFLKFIDLSGVLKSALLVRFMDDFALFDDDPIRLRQDFIRIQQLLGQYGLNINSAKTHYDKGPQSVDDALTDIKQSLIEIVDQIQALDSGSGIEFAEVEMEVVNSLNADQVAKLLALLRDDALEESDADQILSFLRAHSDSILEHIPTLLDRFPNLIKHVYSVCSTITEKKELASVLLDYLKSDPFLLEYQLFWIACIVEDHLMGQGPYGEILLRLFEQTTDCRIAKAKVLEIPEQSFGLKEIRAENLKTGQSDWLSWASAMGSRTLSPAERNHVLGYFSRASPLNHLVAECVKKL